MTTWTIAFLDFLNCFIARLCRGLRAFLIALAGPLGFWFANIGTVIGAIIAVTQVQFFQPIQEVTTRICLNGYFDRSLMKLMGYRNQQLYGTLLPRELPYFKGGIGKLGTVIKKEDALFTIYLFPQVEFRGVLAGTTTKGHPYQLRIAEPPGVGPFNRLTFDQAYLVSLDYTDNAVILTLLPAPRTPTLERQMACRQKPWSEFRKSMQCPFI